MNRAGRLAVLTAGYVSLIALERALFVVEEQAAELRELRAVADVDEDGLEDALDLGDVLQAHGITVDDVA